MFNRHRQSRGNIDDYTNEEQRALLASTSNPPTVADDFTFRVVATTSENNTGLDATLSYATDSNPKFTAKLRKIRDKHEESKQKIAASSDNHQIRCSHHTSTPPVNPSVQLQHSYGDSLELPAIARPTPDRGVANCSIGIGDSRYKQPTSYVYYIIQPGDTLHNLSVRYSCPIASIKRLNNIWSEQDFFGLTKIRLPVGKLRLIEEVIQDDIPSNHGSYLSRAKDDNIDPWELAGPSETPRVNYTESESLVKPDEGFAEVQDDPATKFLADQIQTEDLFKNLDKSIERARVAAKSYDQNASAIMQRLADSGNIVGENGLDLPEEHGVVLNDLSEFGLSYNFLLLFIFIVCLVCPLAYVIYLEESHREHHQYHLNEQPEEVTKSNAYYEPLKRQID